MGLAMPPGGEVIYQRCRGGSRGGPGGGYPLLPARRWVLRGPVIPRRGTRTGYQPSDGDPTDANPSRVEGGPDVEVDEAQRENSGCADGDPEGESLEVGPKRIRLQMYTEPQLLRSVRRW
jgi:hypothetical protein